MLRNVELRKLPAATLCSIATILETNNDWKKVMSHVPRNPRSDSFEPKYNNDHIKQIEDHARASNKKCAEIMFEEWGTSGRIRPTLGTLKDVVQAAGIYRAADELALMLQEEPPERPSDGPAAPIDTAVTLIMQQDTGLTINNIDTTKQISDPRKPNSSIGNKTTTVMTSGPNVPALSKIMRSENSVNEQADYQTSLPNIDLDSKGVDSDILQNPDLIHFSYNDLEFITKKFMEKLIYIPDPSPSSDNHSVQGKLAGKIGSGGFGEVFVGWHPHYGHLAVKRARSNVKFERKPDLGLKVFNTEVRFLSQFRHKNIVPILGFSLDGPSLCIVCEYIDGGSLEAKIQQKVLTDEKQRISIMIGTAEGLRYLHASEKPGVVTDEEQIKANGSESKKNNFVHGDVKTANILLTRDCVPKLCDFGLAKKYESTIVTSCPMGTSAYMAPEGFYGTITQKIDIYSYGICLLELLTGLKSIVPVQGETINIKDYLEDLCPNNEIHKFTDPFTVRWTKAKEIYALARNCLERQRKSRPTAEQICETLYKIRGSD